MPPNRFESEVESFLEGSHGDRTHIKRADHPRLHHYAGRYLVREKVRPAQPLQRPIREKTRPASPKMPKFGCFQRTGRTFSRSRPQSGPAGRTFSRTGYGDVATLKPTTPLHPLMLANVKPPSPLLAPNKGPLKPPSPLQPKNTPNTPISHPQRRWQFQQAHHTDPQRR